MTIGMKTHKLLMNYKNKSCATVTKLNLKEISYFELMLTPIEYTPLMNHLQPQIKVLQV